MPPCATCAQTPYTPIRLRANVSSIYAFQNPGHDEDTPGGELLNVKRDLDILQRLGLTPGATDARHRPVRPAAYSHPHGDGIAGYDAAASGAGRPATAAPPPTTRRAWPRAWAGSSACATRTRWRA